MRLEKIHAGLILVCLLCITAWVSAAQPLARNALIGKWKATVSDDNGKDSNDTLTFKGSQFTSDNEKADGYDPATYDDDPSPQGISSKFSATLTNKAGDTAKWEGFSTGNEMTGTLVVTKKDGTKINYTFKASKS